jgi:hypothetical protein
MKPTRKTIPRMPLTPEQIEQKKLASKLNGKDYRWYSLDQLRRISAITEEGIERPS